MNRAPGVQKPNFVYLLYSKRQKSEFLDFGQYRFGSVVKQFRFRTRPINKQNHSVSIPNWLGTSLNWFGTGFVPLSPKRLKSEGSITEQKFFSVLQTECPVFGRLLYLSQR